LPQGGQFAARIGRDREIRANQPMLRFDLYVSGFNVVDLRIRRHEPHLEVRTPDY
jgi:hypothetical protein